MNQKAFAIFVGGIMVLSAFAGFVLRGGNEEQNVSTAGPASLDTFGVQGRLIDWNFDSLEDTLAMCPENTTMAYWLNTSKSQNLTDVARVALPPSLGLSYGSQLYPTKIERLALAYFNSTFAEFHWITPFPVGYSGIVLPYQGYMMIPTTADFSAVMGMPTLFGPQKGVEGVLDVLSGGMPADKFTLPQGEVADLQLAALGNSSGGMLGGGYQEFYMGVTATNSGYTLDAKYLKPDADAAARIQGVATKYGLPISTKGALTEVTGNIGADRLKDTLTAFTQP
jgi:hypothetical protein